MDSRCCCCRGRLEGLEEEIGAVEKPLIPAPAPEPEAATRGTRSLLNIDWKKVATEKKKRHETAGQFGRLSGFVSDARMPNHVVFVFL